MSDEIGYLGPPGTFGEQAALLYRRRAHLQADLRPLPTHVEVVRSVDSGAIDLGIIPVENALEGAVTESLDAILAAPNVWLCAELTLPVEHYLVAAPGTAKSDVSVVMSHPQALAQCRGFLERELPNARLEASLSTATAVEEASRTPGVAGIGTRRAAVLHGGAILAEGIQDERQNETRFVAVARYDAAPTGDDKTSIAFSVDHDRPGTLIAALREISDRGLNMTHIQLRPSRRGVGFYVFLIDVLGHKTEPAVAEALAGLKRCTNFLRILGSYPRFSEA
jgi:prephenate dehydratase